MQYTLTLDEKKKLPELYESVHEQAVSAMNAANIYSEKIVLDGIHIVPQVRIPTQSQLVFCNDDATVFRVVFPLEHDRFVVVKLMPEAFTVKFWKGSLTETISKWTTCHLLPFTLAMDSFLSPLRSAANALSELL